MDRRTWVVCWAVVAACKTVPVPPPVTESVRIPFVPALGAWVEETVTTRKEGTVEETVRAELVSEYERAPDGTWVLTQSIPVLKLTRAGNEVTDPMVALVTKFPIRIQLSAHGTVERYLNPDAVVQAVRDVFQKKEEADAVLELLTPEAVEGQARREWNGKYGGLFDSDLKPGMVFRSEESVMTGNGPLHYQFERKVVGTAETEHGKALVLSLRCEGAEDVQCEGQQWIAVSPFIPIKTQMRLRARGMTLEKESHGSPRKPN